MMNNQVLHSEKEPYRVFAAELFVNPTPGNSRIALIRWLSLMLGM